MNQTIYGSTTDTKIGETQPNHNNHNHNHNNNYIPVVKSFPNFFVIATKALQG